MAVTNRVCCYYCVLILAITLLCFCDGKPSAGNGDRRRSLLFRGKRLGFASRYDSGRSTRYGRQSPSYEDDSPFVENNEETSRSFVRKSTDFIDEYTSVSKTKNDEDIETNYDRNKDDLDIMFSESDNDFVDSSLTVFDKKRHFEVSAMIASDVKDAEDLEDISNYGQKERFQSLLFNIANDDNLKEAGEATLKLPEVFSKNTDYGNVETKSVNHKRNNRDPIQFLKEKDETRLPKKKDQELPRSFSDKTRLNENNSSIVVSRGRDVHDVGKANRRLNSPMRELTLRRNQEKASRKQTQQQMQNDHGVSKPEDSSNKNNNGELVDTDLNSQDPAKVEFPDKIRQIRTRLHEPHYTSSLSSSGVTSANDVLGISCDFEQPCAWRWNASNGVVSGFGVYTGEDVTALNETRDYLLKGPEVDADNNNEGHFLYLPIGPTTGVMTIRSPEYQGTMENCKIEVSLHQYNMHNASFKVVTEPANGAPPWVLSEVQGYNYESWTKNTFNVGRVQREFRIVLEVVPGSQMATSAFRGAHIAVDNMKMAGCFPEIATVDKCSPRQLKCMANKVPACINSSRVCDILQDCDKGEDERQDCDKMPFGSRCSFEDGWCGFLNTPTPRVKLKWALHSGPTPTEHTGPEGDHTCRGTPLPMLDSPYYSQIKYNQTSLDTLPSPIGENGVEEGECIGQYLYVNMAQHGNDNVVGFASNANLDSVVFNPPPRVHGDVASKYYNSCMIRFYYHQYGKNSGSISLLVIELKDKENSSNLIWWSSKNQGEDWVRAVVILPNVTTRYYLQFETRRGMRIYSDVAIDDFSMAPECFGINIPHQNLGDYNYWDPVHSGADTKPHKDFENKTYYELTTCGSSGRFGPNQEQCDSAYANTSLAVQVPAEHPYNGFQAWTVPNEGYYTIILRGAGGGLGSGGTGSSRGASVRALLDLRKGQVIYALVGQQGTSACLKTLSVLTESNCKHLNNSSPNYSSKTGDLGPYYHSKTHEIKNTVVQDGGGGGGGGTFLFMITKVRGPSPILVAGGGGGLGAGRLGAGGSQHGRTSAPPSKRPRTGDMYGPPNSTPGAGGGWLPSTGLVTPGHEVVRGEALTMGGMGGKACVGGGGPGAGGFGGGGGGCARGGAAGGWAGGDTSQNMTNGEGGYSYVDQTQVVPGFTEILASMHSGSGQIIIIPAIEGCGCDYRCVALDEYRFNTQCICPQGWVIVGDNNTVCGKEVALDDQSYPMVYVMVILVFATVISVAIIFVVFIMLYNRYQVRKQAALRHKALLEQDLRLSRLRSTTDESALSNFNPNYGCDAVLAGGVDVRQLPQVARDSLRLVKALGQGAFGEVYQGLYRHRDGDAIEMPVAVKTLPEMSTGQSETDFLMEAAIMAKFNHPNIVHLIGVCFDRHPRFIVLELLAGGDLKNFLRENRPKPERSSSLGMKDLVLCALDVAKGCRYMETKRFIHRDIAARNCLLTSKGPGRVVKIADFGMARDIYRADYYRKGGKAMLPIKWMPPEAFLDGIFTSKTDVWSFGVLLWEVFSLGIMPYTGCANREVMQMVTGGGRLDIPHGCPIDIYRMMCDCWNPCPQDRPPFSQLFEKLTHNTQDPDLMAAPLPCFTRAVPLPRDSDGMNQGGQSGCGSGALGGQASDYLVPLLPLTGTTVHDHLSAHSSSSDRLLSSSSHSNDDSNLPTSSIAGQSFRQLHPPEYGNIALATRAQPVLNSTPDQNESATNQPIPAACPTGHQAKFQPSKSTDRLLASMEAPPGGTNSDDDDELDNHGRPVEWETSFTERGAVKKIVNSCDVEPVAGPPVDKLISIDTPQQTPTSLQPPDNSLSRTIYQNRSPTTNSQSQHSKHNTPSKSVKNNPDQHATSAGSSPPYKKIVLPSNVNFVKQRPLCLDAAQLEQNLNALKKNSGSVNLNNMNILPPYVNVLTPNKLSKSESRKIQIDPKKAIIHDLASPPGAEGLITNDNIVNEASVTDGEPRLKTSASANSLLNGPLTDLPYADSDNASSASSSGGNNMISRMQPGSKQNNYTEVTILEDSSKKPGKGNQSGGFLNNDSEISC